MRPRSPEAEAKERGNQIHQRIRESDNLRTPEPESPRTTQSPRTRESENPKPGEPRTPRT